MKHKTESHSPSDGADTDTQPVEPSEPVSNRLYLSGVLAPAERILAKIAEKQSLLDRNQEADAARERRKRELVTEFEKEITDAETAICATDRPTSKQFGELIIRKLGREGFEKVFDQLIPAPVIDTETLQKELAEDICALLESEREPLLRVWQWNFEQALKLLGQTLGNDPSHDAEGIDREAIASSTPACRRVESMIMARQGFLRAAFRLDLSTTDFYRSLYQSQLDEVRRELELVEGELPPPRAQEPDRKLKPIIVSRPQQPEELPPAGWSVRRTVSS